VTTRQARRFWLQASLAAASLALACLTIASREWIEVVFRIDPDGGSGALEWGAVVVLALLAATLGARAHATRRRAAPSG
jgi:hypothetical protein